MTTRKIWKLVTIAVTMALTVQSMQAQESAGNGVLYNALNEPNTVIVQPTGGSQQTESHIQIAPGTRLEMVKYPGYRVFLDSKYHGQNPNAVYELDVAKENGGHFFYLTVRQEKVVIAKGLPKEVFSEIADKARNEIARAAGTWDVNVNDSGGLQVSESRRQQFSAIRYCDLLSDKLGVNCAVFVHRGIKTVYILTDTQLNGIDLESLVLPVVSEEDRSFKVSQIVVPPADKGWMADCDNMFMRSNHVKSKPSERQKGGATHVSTGEFAGVDGTRESLDLFAVQYQRFRYFESRGSLRSHSVGSVLRRLGLMYSVYCLGQQNVRELDSIVATGLAREIQSCFELDYVEKNSGVASRVFVDDGYPSINVEYSLVNGVRNERTEYFTVNSSRLDRIDVTMELGDEVVAIMIRGAIWKGRDSRNPVKAESAWTGVQVSNPVSFVKGGRYEVRIKSVSGQTIVHDAIFQPTVENARYRVETTSIR